MKKSFILLVFSLAVLLAGTAAAFQDEMCGDGVCSEGESTENCPEDCFEEQTTGFFGLGQAGNIGAVTILVIIFIGFVIYLLKKK